VGKMPVNPHIDSLGNLAAGFRRITRHRHHR
jgi:hypothetical protein